ncbi:hypothetical protein BKA70DRAFT_679158 [Coprinopsis sp. MPI-PUGE-AT-0042]|nr:hypothetical protein BKA70DRAFT_679158 [Coprinopsis sp. MPI-PUGE-AT-0042]
MRKLSIVTPMSGATSPINRLPPEILLRIFQYLHSAERRSLDWRDWTTSDDEAILKRAVVPYSVSSICRHWDEVSTLDPELWDSSRVLVSLDSHDGGSPAQVTQKCLHRAPHEGPFVVEILCGESQQGEEARAVERQRVAALLPILSAHLHQFSRLSITTMFASSLPPFSFLSPTSDLIVNLQSLSIRTMEEKGLEAPSFPPWRDSDNPSLGYAPAITVLDLSGSTFISYCRSMNRLQNQDELWRGQTLVIRHLFDNSPDRFMFEELLEFLERVGPSLRKLILKDIDLRPNSPLESTISEDRTPPVTWPNPTTIFLTRVNADTVHGLLSLSHRQVDSWPMEMSLYGCPFPSPLSVSLVSIQRLIVGSYNVRSSINMLSAIDPLTFYIDTPGLDVGDGVEFFQQLDAVHRDDGTPLLSRTGSLIISDHGYLSLDALCPFVDPNSLETPPVSLHLNLAAVRLSPHELIGSR